MNFEHVRRKADLDTLDHEQIVEGYLSAQRGDPEPGANRGRAFWHGWCNRMRDYGELPQTDASRALIKEIWSRGVFKGDRALLQAESDIAGKQP